MRKQTAKLPVGAFPFILTPSMAAGAFGFDDTNALFDAARKGQIPPAASERREKGKTFPIWTIKQVEDFADSLSNEPSKQTNLIDEV